MSNGGGSPRPTRKWYDVRPTPLAGTLFDPDAFVDLGNGDYRGLYYNQSLVSLVHVPVHTGTISLTCVPLSGDLSAGRVFAIDVEAMYSEPGVFKSEGGNGIAANVMECVLGGSGVDIRLFNLPKCAILVAWEAEFIGRLLFGEESDVAALSALPLVYGSAAEDDYPYAPWVEEGDKVYLYLNPFDYSSFKVFGFNLMPAEGTPLTQRPSVRGLEAGSGVACPVVGGLYGMEVSMPDITFAEVWFYYLDWWLCVAEV